MAKPTVAVYKFSSCDGCQLTILNLEDELLDLVGVVEIAYFLEARRHTLPGPYDIALVEGSVTTPHEAERIQEIRKQAKSLVTIGACATSGGIQALRNTANLDDLAMAVYEHPEYLHTLPTSTAISEHVKVDYELWGCPVNKYQLVEVIQALLQKRRPNLPTHSICLDCKRKGIACVIVAHGYAMSGSSHSHRLRCALPIQRSRLLWLLRSRSQRGYENRPGSPGSSRALTPEKSEVC